MKKLLSTIIFLFSLSVCTAQAAPPPDSYATQTKKPFATASQGIAMLFYKMTGQTPDFQQWAMASESYEKASRFDKDLALGEKIKELRGLFTGVDPKEAIIIQTPAVLSEYSIKNKGFLVENFSDEAFYTYTFMGKRYAVVPQGEMEHQWISIDDPETVEKIKTASRRTADPPVLLLYIEPTFADGKAPLHIGGVDYWLIAGKLRNIGLYTSRTDDALLWALQESKNISERQQELLQLYKR